MLTFKQIEDICNYLQKHDRNGDWLSVFVEYDEGELSYDEVINIFTHTLEGWKDEIIELGMSDFEKWMLDSLNIRTYKRYNTDYVRKQFIKTYDSLFDFGNHFNLTDCYKYKGTLYTSKGKFFYEWDFYKEEWFLVKRELYNFN